MQALQTLSTSTPATRAHIEVRGIVQGVGFRPFVYRLASSLALDGWVKNDAAGVTIEVQGDPVRVARMAQRLGAEAPPRARIDSIDVHACALRAGDGFAILESGGGLGATAIGPDSAVCDDCLAELFDPCDRRYRYAFINCTNCGPRYTITRALPYDRAMTSMAPFPQCADCLAEYRAPAHRRFHAEPNACPDCGPGLELLDAAGVSIAGSDPIAVTLARLGRGEIVAIKGLGGFHLACDARNGDAVARLRSRKAREEKPFAVMVAGIASLQSLAQVTLAEEALLAGAERPIALLRKHVNTDTSLPGVAPGLAWLGAMLPYTPLHYLLFHEAAGRPAGTAWLDAPHGLVLVMTSANPGGEPLVTSNAEALRRLSGIVDCLLVHDRSIVTGCDDSVLRAMPRGEGAGFQFVRRARGYTPRAIKLARSGPPLVALGGYFKSTVCVTRGDEAFVSQHIGDLDNASTCVAMVDAVEHLTSILEVEPQVVAHDLHPDFFSTRYAARLAQRLGVPLLGVQHHHAHIAAVAAEHRVVTPVLGLALDGVGLGSDGGAWGGELLRVDGSQFERLGRLSPLRLPGGDLAAREPWRMAAAALALCGRAQEIAARFADEPVAGSVATMLARRFNAPETSSAGRAFDAAAGLLGVKRRIAFEGQAAMLLEGLAEQHGPVEPQHDLFSLTSNNDLALAPLFSRLADERDAGFGAALFHATLVEALAEWVARAAHTHGIRVVACGGGCFLNAILARELRSALGARSIVMLEAMAVPPNDGGLSLGQAWVASQTHSRNN
jgi:hydrogenase maturation protein HypF